MNGDLNIISSANYLALKRDAVITKNTRVNDGVLYYFWKVLHEKDIYDMKTSVMIKDITTQGYDIRFLAMPESDGIGLFIRKNIR